MLNHKTDYVKVLLFKEAFGGFNSIQYTTFFAPRVKY